MTKMLSPSRLLGVAAIASFAFVAAASAATSNAAYTSSTGIEGLGAFTAQVTYSYVSGTTAAVTIGLTNTTSAGIGGYITAIAFNGATGVTGLSFVSSTSGAFSGLTGPISASPFNDFAAGASTGNSWLGGGSPNGGIAVGQTASFTFNATGSSSVLNALNAGSVFSVASGQGMAIRFRGMNNGGSDKVLGHVENVPGPGALAGFAMLLTGAGRRRRS